MTPTMIKLLLIFVVCELVTCLYDIKHKGQYDDCGEVLLLIKSFVCVLLILVIIFQLRYLG